MTTTGFAPALGAAAPDLELADVLGHPVRLASLWRHQPLVLVVLGRSASPFYADLAYQLRDARELLEQAGADVAAVADAASTELMDANLRYLLLVDPAQVAAKALGLGEDQAGSFIIDTAGIVRFAHRNADPGDSPAAWTLIDAVCAITGAHVERLAVTPKEIEQRAQPTVGQQLQAPGRPMPGLVAGSHAPEITSYECPKCHHTACSVTTLSTAGGWLSRIFNFQYRKFSAVTCTRCTYTELYKSDSGALANIFDLLAGT